MTQVLLILSLWLVCGVGCAGLAFAFFQDEFPTIAKQKVRGDLGFALVYGLIGGPIALVLAFFLSGFAEHGWRLSNENKS